MCVCVFTSAGLYRGWFPVVTSVCCSNFVYFYVFTGLKAIAYKDGAKPYPAKDLILAFVAGKNVYCIMYMVFVLISVAYYCYLNVNT